MLMALKPSLQPYVALNGKETACTMTFRLMSFSAKTVSSESIGEKKTELADAGSTKIALSRAALLFLRGSGSLFSLTIADFSKSGYCETRGVSSEMLS